MAETHMSAARSSSRRSAPARDDGTNSDGSDAQFGHQDQSDLLGKYAGPEWSGERDDHADWAWEAMPHLDSMGLEEVRLGLNRWKMVSSDSKIKKKYHKHLRKLFRSVLRMISKRTTAGKSLRLMLRAEFGEERDGYLLLEYLSNYAAEMNPAQIKSLKKEIAGTTFSAGAPRGARYRARDYVADYCPNIYVWGRPQIPMPDVQPRRPPTVHSRWSGRAPRSSRQPLLPR